MAYQQSSPPAGNYIQDSPDWEPEHLPNDQYDYQHPVNKWPSRGSKGDRKGQAARYYQRNKSRRRRYMREYMRSKRAQRAGRTG